MTKLNEIYVCQKCGNTVEIIGAGKGELVCCGVPMTLQIENTVDASREKHLPVVTVDGDWRHVKVGSVPHPMEEKHYIEWIELIQNGQTKRTFLKPGDKPEAAFQVVPGPFTVRAYCNLHGLWKDEKTSDEDEGKTKTIADLQAAFNGESNASAKYTVYAAKSQELGYPLAAALFRAASKAENIHATAHSKVIQSLGATPQADIKTYTGKEISEMLKDAIAGETHEFTEMYPEFIADAEKADIEAAVVSFERAMDAEKEHAKLYKVALENLADWKKTDKQFVVCPICGYTAFEVESNCPICAASKSRFLTFKPE
ncbi:MAG: desulfoferrodoxin [Thermoguttaceae bacterium]